MKKPLRARSRRLSLVLALATCFSATALQADESSNINTGLQFPVYQTGFIEDDTQKREAETAARDPGLVSDNSDDNDADKTVSLKEYNELKDEVSDIKKSWEDYQKKVKSDADAKKKKPAFKINGRVHLDNWNFLDEDPGVSFLESGDPTDDTEDRFNFRRLRLTWTGNVPGNMLYRIMIDFNNPNRPELKDGYLGWNNLPFNQTILLGNQKRPLGMDHLNSSRHNVFIERPLAVETFNEDARRLGACMYGHSDDEVVNWRYGAFLLENLTNDGRYRGDATEGGLYGRLAASPWYDDISGGRGYWHCAVAGSVNQTDPDGTLDADENNNEGRFRTRPLARSNSRWWNTGRILGADAYQQLAFESVLNIGSLQITGEYFNNWVQRDPLGGFNGSDLHFHGGYIFASYFLTGEHVPLKRTAGVIDRVKPFENFFIVDRCTGGTGRGWGALAIALRGDYLDLSDSDIRGGRGYAVTTGLNWYWTAYSKLQTNYIFGEISNAGQDQFGAPSAFGTGGDFHILGFRYMIDF